MMSGTLTQCRTAGLSYMRLRVPTDPGFVRPVCPRTKHVVIGRAGTEILLWVESRAVGISSLRDGYHLL